MFDSREPASRPATAQIDRPPPGDTKEKLLEAAERLFAAHGVHRASLRAITREAEANLAAVHYHFGSKEALLEAVLARRLEPLNRRRLELLDEALRRQALAGEATPRVDAIVHAFVAPVLTMVRRDHRGHDFARFVSRTFSDPDPRLRALVLEAFGEVVERFNQALRAALPHLDEEEVYWRFFFMVGAMTQTAGFGNLMHRLSGGVCDPLDTDSVIARLVTFLDAGLRAPAVTGAAS